MVSNRKVAYPNRVKQLPLRFQQRAQEQLTNQQQQQHLQSRYSTTLGYSHSYSVPSCSQGITQKRDNVHTSNATSLDGVLMPKDDTVNPEDGEMNEIDHELEEFQRFCLMNKPLENCPKVAVKVNLKDLAFKKT